MGVFEGKVEKGGSFISRLKGGEPRGNQDERQNHGGGFSQRTG